MLYLANAITIGFMAAIWSKEGWQNIALTFALTALMVFNAVGAYPVLSQFVKF